MKYSDCIAKDAEGKGQETVDKAKDPEVKAKDLEVNKKQTRTKESKKTFRKTNKLKSIQNRAGPQKRKYKIKPKKPSQKTEPPERSFKPNGVKLYPEGFSSEYAEPTDKEANFALKSLPSKLPLCAKKPINGPRHKPVPKREPGRRQLKAPESLNIESGACSNEPECIPDNSRQTPVKPKAALKQNNAKRQRKVKAS